jgi:hypothetical protein
MIGNASIRFDYFFKHQLSIWDTHQQLTKIRSSHDFFFFFAQRELGGSRLTHRLCVGLVFGWVILTQRLFWKVAGNFLFVLFLFLRSVICYVFIFRFLWFALNMVFCKGDILKVWWLWSFIGMGETRRPSADRSTYCIVGILTLINRTGLERCTHS